MLAKACDGQNVDDNCCLCVPDTRFQGLPVMHVINDSLEPRLAVLLIQHSICYNTIIEIIVEKFESPCLTDKHQTLVAPGSKSFIAGGHERL